MIAVGTSKGKTKDREVEIQKVIISRTNNRVGKLHNYDLLIIITG